MSNRHSSEGQPGILYFPACRCFRFVGVHCVAEEGERNVWVFLFGDDDEPVFQSQLWEHLGLNCK